MAATLGRTLDFDTCIEAAKHFTSRQEFMRKDAAAYSKCCQNGWLDEVCSHMPILKRCLTFSFCEGLARTCTTRAEFKELDGSAYQKARRMGWLDQVCSHMVNGRTGGNYYSKSRFIETCVRNNDGNGVLYLIRCEGNSEWFYKVGRTSSSADCRFSRTKYMPYQYRILWEIEGNASVIFDWEVQFKRKLGNYHYLPKIPFSGSVKECFKCNRNNSILKI